MKNLVDISAKIISRFPYKKEFLFIDDISFINEYKVIGHYTFKKESCFYLAHFSHIPIIPNVIITEMTGQIGAISHLIFFNKLYKNDIVFHPILSNIECDFIKQVNVEERLTVVAEKEYYRNNILKSNAILYNSQNNVCASFKAQSHLVYD
jgi:3-hydroxyacyl-[acyl-carrier-protein] dehydratase